MRSWSQPPGLLIFEPHALPICGPTAQKACTEALCEVNGIPSSRGTADYSVRLEGERGSTSGFASCDVGHGLQSWIWCGRSLKWGRILVEEAFWSPF